MINAESIYEEEIYILLYYNNIEKMGWPGYEANILQIMYM